MRQRKTKRHYNVKKCHDWFVGPERYSKFALKSKSSEMLFSAIFMEYILEKKNHSDVLWIVFKLQTYAFVFLLQKPTRQLTTKHLKIKVKSRRGKCVVLPLVSYDPEKNIGNKQERVKL